MTLKKMKANDQTVFVTLGGSSTLEFQTVEKVPVYEPAERGWINAYYHLETITVVDEDGNVTRRCVETGKTTRWCTRPTMQNVVAMGMKDKIGGYYFEFTKNGSIISSCKDGSYYWGSIEDVADEILSRSCMGHRYVDNDTLWGILQETHFRITDPMEVLREEIADWWDCQFDKEWRRSTSLQKENEMDTSRLTRVKERLATDPRIYNNPEVRAAYEEEIARIESGIVHNQSLVKSIDDYCPECRRDGVCMCYT